jgi:hypothetical protein
MRYVVIGLYSAIQEYSREQGIPMHLIIPVPQGGHVGQVLHGLNPEETTIVLAHGCEQSMTEGARALISRYQALGAQTIVRA